MVYEETGKQPVGSVKTIQIGLDITVTMGKNWFNNLKINIKAKQSLSDIFSYSQRVVLDTIKYFEQSNFI